LDLTGISFFAGAYGKSNLSTTNPPKKCGERGAKEWLAKTVKQIDFGKKSCPILDGYPAGI